MTPAEVAVLRVMQVRMMYRDVEAERKDKVTGRKAEQLAAFASATSELLVSRSGGLSENSPEEVPSPEQDSLSADDIVERASDLVATIFGAVAGGAGVGRADDLLSVAGRHEMDA